MKLFLNLTFILLMAFCFTGCATSPRATDNSYVYVTDQPVPIVISDVILRRLISEYPPAKNRLNLLRSDNVSFDDLLEYKCRFAGYAITDDPNAIQIRYVIDLLENNAGYLSLKSSRGLEFNQLFNTIDYSLAENFTELNKEAVK